MESSGLDRLQAAIKRIESAPPLRSRVRVRDMILSVTTCIVVAAFIKFGRFNNFENLALAIFAMGTVYLDWFTARLAQIEAKIRELTFVSSEALIACSIYIEHLEQTKVIRVAVNQHQPR